MVDTFVNQYLPDVVSPPGETLLDILEERGISQAELAERMNRPKKTINEIIKGKTAITAETALQLELALGVPASFWTDFEGRYRQYLARIEETERLSTFSGWLKELPFKTMVNYGWIANHDTVADRVREVLTFFGVTAPKPWEELGKPLAAAYRQSKAFSANPASVAAWLRQGHIQAQQMHCEPFDEQRFKSLLPKLRLLTRMDPSFFAPQLVNKCAACGVAVIILQELPGTRLSGAARWINPQRAVIQLSLRYKTNDHFWFTFFHEAGHILLHGKRSMFVDVVGGDLFLEEVEANEFAANTLIPLLEIKPFLESGVFTEVRIRAFADRLEIDVGIVVGRLQHEGKVPWKSPLNKLKQPLRWN